MFNCMWNATETVDSGSIRNRCLLAKATNLLSTHEIISCMVGDARSNENQNGVTSKQKRCIV